MQGQKLLEQASDIARFRHLSLRTERAYRNWIRRYVFFHNKQHPRNLDAGAVCAFLTHLAVNNHVSLLTRVGNGRSAHYTQFDFAVTLQPPTGNLKTAPQHGTFSARGFRFAIVASRWNDEIVSRLIEGARAALAEASADQKAIETFRVPGSFEIPLCALKAAETGKFDAVICLGVIIRGDTPHFEYVARETARGIGEASLKTGVPLLFGVITADNDEQANERARADGNNKGYEAARAAVEIVNLYREAFGAGPRAVARG